MSLPVFTRQLPLHGVDNLLGDSFAATDPFRLFTEQIYPLLAGARGMMAQVLYKFGWGEQCAGCPLKDLCLGKNQTQRSLEVGEHHTHLQQRRKDQKTEEFKEKMHRRSAIEGTQSELVRGHGMRQARYSGPGEGEAAELSDRSGVQRQTLDQADGVGDGPTDKLRAGPGNGSGCGELKWLERAIARVGNEKSGRAEAGKASMMTG